MSAHVRLFQIVAAGIRTARSACTAVRVVERATERAGGVGVKKRAFDLLIAVVLRWRCVIGLLEGMLARV